YVGPLARSRRRQTFSGRETLCIVRVRVSVKHNVRLMAGDRHDDRVRNTTRLEHTGEIVAQIVWMEISHTSVPAKTQPARTDRIHRHVGVVATWKNPWTCAYRWLPADEFIRERLTHRNLAALTGL